MNERNETFVTPEMLEKMRREGVADGYEPVPREIEKKVRRMLGNKQIVTYSNDAKLKKQIARLKNRLHEAKMREAAQSPVVLEQLAAYDRLKSNA